MRFGLVIEYIDHSQVVSITKYRTLADSHTTNHPTPNFLSVLLLVFTIRFLATDLSKSQCNFNSHIHSSSHNIIYFLLIPLNQLGLPYQKLDTIFRTTVLYCYSASTSPVLPNTSYNHFARTPRKAPFSVVKNTCLPARYLAMDVLLLLSACAAGMCFPCSCLAMGILVTLYTLKNKKGRFVFLFGYVL
jgi:hypothetical protein